MNTTIKPTRKHRTVTAVCLAALLATAGTALAGRGANRAEIAQAVRSGNPDAIAAILEKAENMPATTETIELVEGLLSSPDYNVREVAAWWFARRPAHKDRLTTEGLAALAGSDSLAARNAADMLGTFRHPRAVTALSAAVRRSDLSAEARLAAVRALGTIGHPAGADALSAAMGDADASVRRQAVLAWAQIRHQDNAVPVVALLSDSDTAVRRAAARVIGKYREASARAQLETALASDPDAVVRRNAAFALGRVGDAASRDLLRQAAESDASSLVRAYARQAARMVGR